MSAYGFMPHGYCFEWRPGVLWLHILSDLGTAFAYYSISILLFYFTQVRRKLPFLGLFLLFGAFIILCGTTHLLSIWVLWHPNYYIEGYFKAVTALVSIATLIVLTRVLPRLLRAAQSLETLVATQNQELAAANRALQAQIDAKEKIESALRQSQKMEAIGQLTGGIAHDFNNMLQAIAGSLELSRRRMRQGRGEDAQHFAETARQTVDRASALTNRLLAFARRQPLQPRPVNLDALIASLKELIRSTAGVAITVTLELNDGGWPVSCDPNQLENAFLNIIINARDAMPDGGVLTIRTRQTHLLAADLAGEDGALPGDYVEIAITDSGVGMDETTRLRVFEPFFTTKPTGQGTGLGLSQVYGFVRQSGGLVWLQSRRHHGTTVRMSLRRADQASEPKPAAAEATPQPATSKAIVLLVEDEPVVREVAAEYLRELGYLILEAGNSVEALDLVRRTPILDLLVTDVGLPNGLNGRQLADAVREAKPVLPVLFITGYAGTAKLDQLDENMQLMGKPFTLPAFADRVRTMLERQRATA